MTTATLRWQGGRLDAEPTPAQQDKARRYHKGGLIHAGQPNIQAAGWGQPSRTVIQYCLDPVAGCREQRLVTVTEFYDAAGNLTAIWYDCDCQRAAGTAARSPGACSHALAVYLHRRDDTRGA